MANKAYVFKISLDECPYRCERTIAISERYTLYNFAGALIAAMGWQMSHLWQLDINGKYYGMPNDEFDDDRMLDAKDYKVSDIFHTPGDQCSMMYDFGDGWEHTIRLEEIRDKGKNEVYPNYISGIGLCPQEDCGGIPGLIHLIEVLNNPNDPEYEEMYDWADGVNPTKALYAPMTKTELRHMYTMFRQVYEVQEY